MCYNPVSIKNPYFDKVKYISCGGVEMMSPLEIYSHKEYIKVPCGKCAECRQSYYNSLFQRAVVESKSSYMYFVTLTYDNDHIPVLRVGDKILYYANYKHIQNMFKRFRKNNVLDRDFRYLSVNEFGDSTKRPHFHLLIFVSKRDTDDVLTPFNIERLLFDNLRVYFSDNVGSLRAPVYDPLFTYVQRWQDGVLRSNYFVKYVDVEGESDTTYKTINYLIGYISKPQTIDKDIELLIENYTDDVTVRRFRNFVRSKVRYSKGFGFGFDNGRKLHLEPIYLNLSANQKYYNHLRANLPQTLERFCDDYPDLYTDIITYLSKTNFSVYSDLKDLYLNIDSHTYSLICIAHLYKLPELRYMNCLTSKCITGRIRDYFDPMPKYNHKLLNVYTYSPDVDNYVFRFIRHCLDQGITAKRPFLPFVYGRNWQPLCNFYKRLCTDYNDILLMYHSIGVHNFDEWLDKFTDYVNNKRAVQFLANVHSHEKNCENICFLQKHYFTLSSDIEHDTGIYTILYN